LGGVQDLEFSHDSLYLATLGAQDDNALVIWDAETGTAICGAPAFEDTGLTVRWLKNRNDRLVTAGNYHLRVWQVDVQMPKLHAMTAKMGNMRLVYCLLLSFFLFNTLRGCFCCLLFFFSLIFPSCF
jgi:cilia- and flagella-associated protein 52